MRYLFGIFVSFFLVFSGIFADSFNERAPEVLFIFQQPSYVTNKDSTLSEFTCDITKPECKINIDLSPSFTGGFLSSDFSCQIDFGMENLTGEETKCNPNTVTLTGSTNFTITLRITKKTNVNIFIEKILIIHSGYAIFTEYLSGEILEDSGISTDSGVIDLIGNTGGTMGIELLNSGGTLSETGVLLASGEILSDTGILDNTGVLIETGILNDAQILSPEVIFTFQQPTYLIDKDVTLSEFTCDITKSECKINIDLSSPFTGGFLPADFSCQIDFGMENLTGEETKCNPNTVTLTGNTDYIVHFRIFKKDSSNIFSERNIIIHSGNSGIIESSSGILMDTESIIQNQIGSPSHIVSIQDPVIVVQSGLDSINHCTKADCTINLEYKTLNTKESCHWNFSGGTYLSGTENKCNPGYIHYPFGEFDITLRVFEQGNISNYREKILHIINKTSAGVIGIYSHHENHLPVAKITLQGVLGKTKIQEGNSVKCIGVDVCSINFTGEESYDGDNDKLSYYWNFGNGQISDKENPPAIKYSTGEYLVVLRVTESRGYSNEVHFRVYVSGKIVDVPITKKLIDKNISSLFISGVNPNPLGDDIVGEWIEIANPLSTDISLLGCELDDNLEKGSTSYIFPDTVVILANSNKRFYRSETHLNLNNTGDSVHLICDGKPISSLSWDYVIPDDYIVTKDSSSLVKKTQTKTLQFIGADKSVNTITKEKIAIEDIHIILQGVLSKNRKLVGNIFTCSTKTTCSVNFTAGKARKNTIYYWNFGKEDIFYGANPLARIFAPGKYTIYLRILDTQNGNFGEEIFHVVIKKIVTPKKQKISKVASVKSEKPLLVKGQDYFTPPALQKNKLSQYQKLFFGGILSVLFFGSVYIIVKRKLVT